MMGLLHGGTAGVLMFPFGGGLMKRKSPGAGIAQGTLQKESLSKIHNIERGSIAGCKIATVLAFVLKLTVDR
jgi:hypothetical protein